MEVSRPLEIARIDEIRILRDVRLIHKSDLNPIFSKDNLRVQFTLDGEIKGSITCYLCLDGHELTQSDRNYIFPLFSEAMNILIGKQISMDDEISHFKISLSTPRLNMNPIVIDTKQRIQTHKYELELEEISFDVLAEYSLEVLN